MKTLFGLILSLVSLVSVASTGETRTFVYDGNQSSVELLLRGEETHTEYRYEQRRSTCTRQVFAGYRRICSGGPRGPRYCNSIPVYRTEYYPCVITVSVPYEVKDYDVEANVYLSVAKLPGAQTRGETFKVVLMGSDLRLEAVGSKKYFLVSKRSEVRSDIRGNIKFLTGTYDVELIEAAPIVNALRMTSISIENDVLTTEMGPVTDRQHLGFSLYVTQVRTFGADPVLFNRDLIDSEVDVNTTNNMAEANVNVAQLGLNLSGGKFRLTMSASFTEKDALLNASQFDVLETSRTLLFTNR